MDKKETLCFLLGLASGAVASAIGTGMYFKRKYSKMAEEEISAIEKRYGVLDKYTRAYRSEKDEVDLIDISRDKESRKAIKEARKRKSEPMRTDYKSFYNNLANGDAIENPDPEIEEDIAIQNDGDEEQERFDDWFVEARNMPTQIILPENINNVPFLDRFDVCTLLYYPEDGDAVTEEDGEVLEDGAARLIGTAIDDSHFCFAEPEDVLTVINYGLLTIYTVVNKPGICHDLTDESN